MSKDECWPIEKISHYKPIFFIDKNIFSYLEDSVRNIKQKSIVIYIDISILSISISIQKFYFFLAMDHTFDHINLDRQVSVWDCIFGISEPDEKTAFTLAYKTLRISVKR